VWEFKQIRIFSWKLLHLAFVYRIYTRDAKRDPTPYWENAEKFITDLKSAWLNGGVQIEQRNKLLYSTITSLTCILLQIRALCMHTSYYGKVYELMIELSCLHNSSLRLIQVCTFHDGWKQGIDQQIINRKSISRNITHPQSLYMNRDMCKFESSQKDESRWQSNDSSKAYRNTSAFKCSPDSSLFSNPLEVTN